MFGRSFVVSMLNLSLWQSGPYRARRPLIADVAHLLGPPRHGQANEVGVVRVVLDEVHRNGIPSAQAELRPRPIAILAVVAAPLAPLAAQRRDERRYLPCWPSSFKEAALEV